jgi:hypothetical protein
MDLPNLNDEPIAQKQEVSDETYNDNQEIDAILAHADDYYTPQVETPEQRIEKTKLVMKLKRYKEIYPKILEDFDLSKMHLDTLSIGDLCLLLEEVKFTVGCRNSSEFFLKSCLTGLAVGENLTTKFTPLKVEGLTYILANDDDFKNTIQEIGLEYQDLTSAPPHIRLLYIVSKTAFALHNQNLQKDLINQNVSGKVRSDVKDKYKDL